MNETTTNKTNKTKNKKITTENVTPVENETKNNETFTFNYDQFFNDYIKCKTKHEIVSVCSENGLYTTTKPTDTVNLNDLYIQFFDKSRLKLNKTSLQIYTCNDISTELETLFSCKSDVVNDGTYRTHRLTLSKTVDTIKSVFDYFSSKTLLYINQLPTKTVTTTTTTVVENEK